MLRSPVPLLGAVLFSGLVPAVAAPPPHHPPSAQPVVGAASRPQTPLGRREAAWVRRALARMSLAEKVAQLVVPGLNGVFTPTDSETFEKLQRLARERGVGGFHVS